MIKLVRTKLVLTAISPNPLSKHMVKEEIKFVRGCECLDFFGGDARGGVVALRSGQNWPEL